MLDSQRDSSTNVEGNTFNQMAQHLRHLGKRDFSRLADETVVYLSLDKQRLRELLEQARQADDEMEVRRLDRRLIHYYVIEKFFLYLADCDHSTKLTDVTTGHIEDFIKYRKPSRVRKTEQSDSVLARDINSSNIWELAKAELGAFFQRAKANGMIEVNVASPLNRTSPRLEPQNPSLQSQSDLLAFQEYLQRRIDSNFLSPGTAAMHFRHCRTLLHDAELRHAIDPTWPTELDELFADSKWIADWLMNLENRSNCTEGKVLARGSVKNYLRTIRQIWLFLQSRGRATKTYYSELKEMFRLDDNSLILPGRAAQIIEALSEAEEAAIFATIERYNINPTLKQRDTALLVTGLQTTMRMDSLNSMRVENFRELDDGIWICRVRAKRSPKKSTSSMDRLTKDKAEWRDWYISPYAYTSIQTYLEITNRTWQSQGPVWLSRNGQPLTLPAQKDIIRRWLRLAGCRFVRPHVLRHTGVDRLINKFNLPIPTVQSITQHADPGILLKIYGQRARAEAFKDINQLFPSEKGDATEYENLLLSISTKLNEISAGIGRRDQTKGTFSREHAEELLDLLGKQLTRLAKFLGYETMNESILITKEAYLKIEAALQSLGLSYRQVLGYEPELQQQTLIKATGRKRKSLLDS